VFWFLGPYHIGDLANWLRGGELEPSRTNIYVCCLSDISGNFQPHMVCCGDNVLE